MITTEQAKQVSRELRNADSHIGNPDLINILCALTNKGADAIDILIAQNDVEITQSKIYEGKLYTAENELRKLKYHSRNVVEQKLNEALTVTAARDGITHELEEQIHLNSIGAEREYVLLGKVAQLERERDKLWAKIELLQAQLVSELAAHESWQNEHLRIDGDQCRQIRELEAERDALRKDAKRWQVIKTLFRVMSPDIDGNHTWVQSHYGTLRGGNMNQAVDNLIKQVGEK